MRERGVGEKREARRRRRFGSGALVDFARARARADRARRGDLDILVILLIVGSCETSAMIT